MITRSRHKMSENTFIECIPSPTTYQTKCSKQAPYASAEHYEFAPVSEPSNKKRFTSFLSRLRSSTTIPSRTRGHERQSTTQGDKMRGHRLDSNTTTHSRVEDLIYRPKNDDDVFNNELVRTHANSSSQNLLRPMDKSELRSMFSGAPCFLVIPKETGYSTSIQTIGEERVRPRANDVGGTVSFEEYFHDQSSADVRPTSQLWNDLLRRVFGNYTDIDASLAQDSRAITEEKDHQTTSPDAQAFHPTTKHKRTSHPHGDSTHPPTRQEFTIPTDGLPILGNATSLESFSCLPAPDSGSLVPTLTFTLPTNRRLPPLDVALLHNVQFVASHPCFGPGPGPGARGTHDARDDSLPSDLLAAQSRCGDCSPSDSACSLAFWPRESRAHPLHESYRFEVVPAACLLSMPLGEDCAQMEGGDAAVVVLDCRDSADLELLARAWCARVGEHAIVSRSERTCIACSVRGATALGFGVVIRI